MLHVLQRKYRGIAEYEIAFIKVVFYRRSCVYECACRFAFVEMLYLFGNCDYEYACVCAHTHILRPAWQQERRGALYLCDTRVDMRNGRSSPMFLHSCQALLHLYSTPAPLYVCQSYVQKGKP